MTFPSPLGERVPIGRVRGCSFSISSMESIYQSRGFVACLKAGFSFVLANPLKVIKAMWILLLIIAISDVCLFAFEEEVAVDIIRQNVGASTRLASVGVLGAYLFQICLAIVGLAYFGRYMIRREEKKYKVKAGRIILRNFWSFLGIFLMALFLQVLLTLIPIVAIEISRLAYNSCMLSETLYNDVVSIPTSGYVSMFVISVLAIVIAEYIGLVVPASLMYKYGSVVYNENEK